MAHAQKFNRSNMGHMLRHYARQPGENVKRNNERIDPDQTHLNYNLAAELQPLRLCERISVNSPTVIKS